MFRAGQYHARKGLYVRQDTYATKIDNNEWRRPDRQAAVSVFEQPATLADRRFDRPRPRLIPFTLPARGHKLYMCVTIQTRRIKWSTFAAPVLSEVPPDIRT
jgi:hypothetical protein